MNDYSILVHISDSLEHTPLIKKCLSYWGNGGIAMVPIICRIYC